MYGMGKDAEGRPSYAMRFVKGDTFKSAVDHLHHDPALRADAAARQREFQKLLRRFLAVCETMEYAHNRGIIHRDLKPRNILLGPYGETLVVDWGLAKVVGHGASEPPSDATLRPPSSSEIEPTLAGSLLGTAAFMSPEQVRGEVAGLGPATDVYGLGATLYYFLTGRAPFDDPDRAEVIRKVQKGEFPAPREVRPTVDRALDAVCRKAMALEPERRYHSAARSQRNWSDGWRISRWGLTARARPRRPHDGYVIIGRGRRAGAAALFLVSVVSSSATLLVECAWSYERAVRERAQNALQESDASFTLARQAVNRFLTKVAGEQLAAIPETEALRGQVAEDAAAFNERLLRTRPRERAVKLETAHAYRIIAGIQRVLGNFVKSRDAYDQAIRLLSNLDDDVRKEPSYLRWLIESYREVASLESMYGKTEEPERDLRTVLGLADQLWSPPVPNAYRRTKGAAPIDLGEILLLRNEPAESQTPRRKP